MSLIKSASSASLTQAPHEERSLCQYVVMGNPIAHSQSPRIHRLFAEQTNQQLSYTAQLVPLDGFADALNQFQLQGGRGANITLPFKQEAFHWVAEVSERAKQARAVNAILFRENGASFGDNTDGIGLVRDLQQNLNFSLYGKTILLLGAGGAASGVLGALLLERPARVVIANRTEEKANQLAELFAKAGAVEASSFSDLNRYTFDLIIHATSASFQNSMPPLSSQILHPGTLCYDMMYGAASTPFLTWAVKQGVKAKDGWGMLVEQAAESFYLWRGVRPVTKNILKI